MQENEIKIFCEAHREYHQIATKGHAIFWIEGPVASRRANKHSLTYVYTDGSKLVLSKKSRKMEWRSADGKIWAIRDMPGC